MIYKGPRVSILRFILIRQFIGAGCQESEAAVCFLFSLFVYLNAPLLTSTFSWPLATGLTYVFIESKMILNLLHYHLVFFIGPYPTETESDSVSGTKILIPVIC